MITLQIDGDKHVIKALNRVSDPVRRRDLMDRIGAYGVSSTQERFIRETGPDGKPWKKSLRAQRQSGSTLRDKNYLFQSLTHNAAERSVEWGSNIRYAGIHQLGGTIRPKAGGKLAFRLANGKFVLASKVEMPARPYLGLNDDDRTEIRDIANEWLQEAFA